MNTKNKNSIEQIQDILTKMQEMFASAEGPRSRDEYMADKGVSGIDYSFGLSAEDIIKDKIPANVIGCTGRAKLFCELAKRRGIKSYVVCTAKIDDWLDVKNHKTNKTINGHQLNAIEIDGVLRVFDVGKTELSFIPTDLQVGSFIDAMGSGKLDYMICAIIPANEFENVNTYQKMRNLYTSSDINNDQFTIKPNLSKTECFEVAKSKVKTLEESHDKKAVNNTELVLQNISGRN